MKELKSRIKSTDATELTNLSAAETWFSSLGWTPLSFQREAWQAFAEGRSGLIHASTGSGKTYAAWLGLINQEVARLSLLQKQAQTQVPKKATPKPKRVRRVDQAPLKAIWISPLRALADDAAAALARPVLDLGLNWSIETRTADTSSAQRSRQRKQLPTVLVTTPESLSLLLTRDESASLFGELDLVVVDEWHELLSTKRGVQVELALARLRRWRPGATVWGLSATIANLDEALSTLLTRQAKSSAAPQSIIIRGKEPKAITVDALAPALIEKLPWAGHLGARQVASVVEEIAQSKSTLVFCNTRNQVEYWYRAILTLRPDWEGKIGLHHGSIDGESRAKVEAGMRSGELLATVCTSSLDLGVDFSPVERVLQIGSPKGVARLVQRAGRSGHQPGAVSRATCVPTHAFELVEIAALKAAMANGWIEARTAPKKPIDVLVQHLATCALGGGFDHTLFDEVRSTQAYADLTIEEWNWTVDFVANGGRSLYAYPEHRRLSIVDGVYRMTDRQSALRHRLSIGTIVSDASCLVRYLRGGAVGTVEESFVARLRPGDTFLFAGKPLELVRLHEMTAWVRKSKKSPTAMPKWLGGRMPLSTELAAAVRDRLQEASNNQFLGPEMEAVAPVLERQVSWSALPRQDEVLIERFQSREGHHLFIYPFEGRAVHEGLAALFATRLGRMQPITFTLSANDYGFEMLSAERAPLDAAASRGLFDPEALAEDVQSGLNAGELAKRQFREIARVAGLVFNGYPGQPKSTKHFHASSSMYFDMFAEFDSDNLLYRQAFREVMETQLQESRLAVALRRMQGCTIVLAELTRPSPLAFPLLVERIRDRISSEKLADRIEKMRIQYEREPDRPAKVTR